jgi:hypothetical protein
MRTHDGRDPIVDQAIAKTRRSQRSDSTPPAADRGGFEEHHLAGRATWASLSVRLWRGDHRTVSELERVLGFDDLPATDGDVILLLAHLLAGLSVLLALLVQYLVAWSQGLCAKYGPDYGEGLPSPVVK